MKEVFIALSAITVSAVLCAGDASARGGDRDHGSGLSDRAGGFGASFGGRGVGGSIGEFGRGSGAPAGEISRGFGGAIGNVRGGIVRRDIITRGLRPDLFRHHFVRDDDACFDPIFGYAYGYSCYPYDDPYAGYGYGYPDYTYTYPYSGYSDPYRVPRIRHRVVRHQVPSRPHHIAISAAHEHKSGSSSTAQRS